MKCKAHENGYRSKTRMVNFVILVVDGLAVLKSIDSDADEGTMYMQMLATTFNCPYLSFKGMRNSSFLFLALICLWTSSIHTFSEVHASFLSSC